jgi:hypothetical protein
MEFSILNVALMLSLPTMLSVNGAAMKIDNVRPSGTPASQHKRRPPKRNEDDICSPQTIPFRPNPLTLVVRVADNKAIKLNQEDMGTIGDLSTLAATLTTIFDKRREQRIIEPDLFNRNDLTLEEKLVKRVYVSGSSLLEQNELERLVGELKTAGTNPVIVIKEETLNTRLSFEEIDSQRKYVSGGVLNGKAIGRPDPEYPPEARAAKASGVVAVLVVVDGFGEVVCAHAVDGHPMLRRPSEKAALLTKFPALRLPDGHTVFYKGVITFKFDH